MSMPKKMILSVFCALLLLLVSTRHVFSIEDPKKVPNNKVGVHILFTDELEDAARLVNANGGDWGYVTIPIQSGDRDLRKWQQFMDKARTKHIVPILRLATEGDYFNTKVWRKPNEADIVDFANFLHSLNWPVKNRYVIIFNEVNRADEWGGETDAQSYAALLSYAVSVFKSKSPDFFILSSGLDNASITLGTKSVHPFEYLRRMQIAVPGIFLQVDGISSHSYPNPAFAQPPGKQDNQSVATFRFERMYLNSLGRNDVPIFITETGWDTSTVSQEKAAQYYTSAFLDVWNDNDVIAVTPFLLRAGGGPFRGFSLLTTSNGPTPMYEALEKLTKIKGQPVLNQAHVLEQSDKTVLGYAALPVRDFTDAKSRLEMQFSVPQPIKTVAKWLLKL